MKEISKKNVTSRGFRNKDSHGNVGKVIDNAHDGIGLASSDFFIDPDLSIKWELVAVEPNIRYARELNNTRDSLMRTYDSIQSVNIYCGTAVTTFNGEATFIWDSKVCLTPR